MAITISGNGITSANIADGTITTDDINASDVTSLKSGRKNLIINGAMQVSQRGDYSTATAITNGTYYLDRWKASITGVTGTVQDLTGSAKYAATSTASGYIGASNDIEITDNFFDGKTVTVSAKVTSNSSNARIALLYQGSSAAWVGGTAHTGGGGEETLTLTVTLPADCTRLLINPRIVASDGVSNVSITSGDYITIKDVQLEVGDTATDFEHRSYGEELQLCLRYFEKLATGEIPENGNYYAGRRYLNPVQFSVQKRTTPSGTVTSQGGWQYGSGGTYGLSLNTNRVSITGISGNALTNTLHSYAIEIDAEL